MGARRGRPTVAVELSGEEREALERWARRPKSSQALALRCRIVLAAAEGRYNKEICETDHWNQNPRPFVWRKTADEILDNLAKYIRRSPQTGR